MFIASPSLMAMLNITNWIINRSRARKPSTTTMKQFWALTKSKKLIDMLHLTLIRKWKNAEYTIGQLYAGGRLICNTVEDTDRGLNMYMKEADIKRIKIQNETAIPVGTYKLAVSVSPKFNRILIEVLNVPGYSGIRIHKGNTAKDSAGCVIPGENKVKGGVINSTHYEELLTSMVESAINNGEDAYLTIL